MSKPASPKARLPRGFADRGPAELAATERMLRTIGETFALYGFEALETPFVEYTDALGKFLPDLDRPNEGVFSFQDDDESWLSLRYDLTAPLARHVAEHFDALPKPYRSTRSGFVFRNEKPGPGRFRQFMQFDADIVGAGSVAADAEILMLMADTLERLGVRRGDYVVKVNNRKVLDGVMEAVGLGGEASAGRRLTVLRAIDKLDRLGVEGVRALLGPGRKDESGDFTKGAGLGEAEILELLGVVGPSTRHMTRPEHAGDALDDDEVISGEAGEGVVLNRLVLDEWEPVVGGTATGREGLDELRQIAALVRAAGYGTRRIRVDPSVVRGLEYYTGPVYEAELTFPVTNEDGSIVRFGSVAGGGRYDGLVGRFRAEPVPATGFSIGVSRLFSALKLVDSPVVAGAARPAPVVVLVLDRDEVAAYQRLVATLRAEGIAAEMYLGGSGMRAQMKYADRRGAYCVVIQGTDERARGEVQVKDLVEGARAAEAIATNAEWKAARPAQFSVPVAEMAARVREVRARHFPEA